jgi:hypothetical protein
MIANEILPMKGVDVGGEEVRSDLVPELHFVIFTTVLLNYINLFG